MAVNKVYPDARSALADQLRDGMLIMAGGFGLCGIPSVLIEAIRDSGVGGLTVVSNNAGIDGVGLGVHLFDRVEGEHAAILGLPLLPLLGFLRQHGVLLA